MKEVRGETFADQATVDTDGTRFVECRFESAVLRYAGGEHPQFENCTAVETGWYFADAALRTVQLLQQIGNTPGPEGRAFIDDLFRPGNYIGD